MHRYTVDRKKEKEYNVVIINPEKKNMSDLQFRNGKFKIMQIADIQEDFPLNPDTVRLIELAIEKETPDLVVLTGDQVQGYSKCYRTDGSSKVRQCIDSFLEPLTKRNIPFAFTFGNHDDDGPVTKKEQFGYYSAHSEFCVGEAADRLDEGTYSIRIKDSKKEKDIFALYLIDSGKKTNGIYDPMKKERIEWLCQQKERNGYLPAMVFQHIPLPEYYDILEECSVFRKGRVEAFHSRKNRFYVLPEKGKEENEMMGESPAPPEINNGEFDEIIKDGDIFAVWAGHDHLNSFRRNLKGVDLGYCQGAGFNTYGPGDRRGVRVFVLDESDLRSYSTYQVTMGELCEYKPTYPFKEFVYSNMPSSIGEVKSGLKRAGAVLAAASVAVAVIVKLSKK